MLGKGSLTDRVESNSKTRFLVSAERDPQFPILEAQSELDWADRKVYNPSVFVFNGTIHMFFRAIGKRDNMSRLGHAVSSDGINFSVDPQPFLESEGPSEPIGVEDPRFTIMDEPFMLDRKQYNIVGTVTGPKAWTSKIKLIAISDDLSSISARYDMLPGWDMNKTEDNRDLWNTPKGRPIIYPGFDPAQWNEELFGGWAKAAGIFPIKINGQYWALWGEYKIRAAISKDLMHWEVIDEPVLSQRKGKFDQAYLEMGPPPIDTQYGWLVFYNGINSLEQEGRIYGVGWAMLDKNDPTKVIDRSDTAILLPETEDEMVGEIDIALINGKTVHKLTPEEFAQNKDKIPMAVFCNGAIKRSDNNYSLYYGAGDKCIKRAVVKLSSI